MISLIIQNKIDEFVKKFPGSSYGPAHILLDDGNILNGHIRFCLKECDTWLKNNEGDKVEIQATQIFLRELLKIPEDDRFGGD